MADARGVDLALATTRGRVVIIGGGFIRCELAAIAATRALGVHLVEGGPTLWRRATRSACCRRPPRRRRRG
ncbi:NAD-binding protein [Frankia sp. AgB1.9]|uniref:FAD-dependent oxidoreductase n=1 Tax=unclassified Frankia TaxID=2632575 RepID=UPI0019339216|nr:NAD-binding protein [Frankia sp. AgW1.1]MBL7552669.1 NAD-binding protein [Frankia sp. AgB1.9]MBL7623834.1 NAD-binding protein [Frankia sp. AgB1.8]